MAIKNLITDHLDLWTAAVRPKSSAGRGASSKLELTGIKKLRELILELAVRGKLVPQDPSDEPASVLLERIAAEKARLVKEGKIKKPKALPEISDEEKPFERPEGWEWSRLQDLTSYIQRGKGPDYTDVGTVKVISQKCIQWSGFDASQARFISDSSINGYQNERFLQLNDLLWNSTGTGTVGRVNILDNLPAEKIVADSHVTVIRTLEVDCNFLWCYIAAPGIQNRIEPGHEKSLVSGSTKQVELSTSAVSTLVIPIPPLSEQHRIVAKVNELMALCDQLELRSESQLTAHQTLVETLLATLTDSCDADELAQNWARLSTHFDTLFTTEASIYALKQTILQLAVMGKLVLQDPSDEPASALLARIAAEKAQLVKEKKIKKEKPLPAISEEEKPFELPQGWEWCRFGTLVNFRAELVKPENFQSFDQVAPDSIEKGTGKLIKRRTVLESGVKGPNSRFYAGQILYSKIRPSLSKAIIADFDGLCSADMYPLDAMISSDFLLKIILSEVFLAQVRVAENRIKMPKLNVDSLSNILVPVCPESEMNRITSKITDLILVCDKLQSRLQTSQQTHLKLVDSLVEQAF